nr:hypothetical protein FVER53263_09945 [Fusarium verticillioides]
MSTTHEPELLLQAVFHHLVLPSKLPSKNDAGDNGLAYDLGSRLRRALAKFSDHQDQDAWNVLVSSMEDTAFLNQGQLISHELLESFQGIASGKNNTWLALSVTQQNSALLIHRDDIEDTVVFEAFQTDAPVQDVLAAKHCLMWEFPHRSVQVPFDVFNDISFQRNLAQLLAQASNESFDVFAAKASKGGKSIPETRNSTNPALIIDMLMSLLEGLGSGVQVQSVIKKVRDDVVLGSSEIPWRRSSYWLVLRVALRRMLRELLDHKCAGMGRVYYKFIICTMLSDLLKDSAERLHPEMTIQLRSKLCRRMAKLEADSAACSPSLRRLYNQLFSSTSEDFGDVVKYATKRVSSQWDDFKARATRRIPSLPRRVAEADLYMRLDNSGAFLTSQLSQHPSHRYRMTTPDGLRLQEGSVLEVGRLADHYISLQDSESAAAKRITSTSEKPQELCKLLSQSIMDLLTNVGDTFKNDSIPMSRHLLRLFELWIKMDEAATSMCPLLKEYHPLFIPDALDVLCLMTRDEMERLLLVQRYIRNRVASHKKGLGTIFDNPRQGSTFPAKYVSSTAAGRQMLVTATRIDDASLRARQSTLSELERLTKSYDSLTQSLNDLTCTCTVSPTGKKVNHTCRRCPKFWRRKKLKISVHEDFLPSPDTDQRKAQRAAILLELLIPDYLSAYRTATWQLYLLGTPVYSSTKGVPKLVLEDIDDLKKFSLEVNKSFTLASRKKSFRQTHYGKLKLPKTPDQVTFRFGPEMLYYDTVSKLWADELPKVPWYQHLLGPWLPQGIADPYEAPRGVLGMLLYHPSSYEIVARESMGPQSTSGNDFCASQRVVSARGRRWLEILKELAASNFDFSTRAANSFFHRLAIQAGPASLEEGLLREAHWVFNSEGFCHRLKERLEAWMDTMEQNWRQVDRMSSVVIFSLRLYHLCPPAFEPQAHELLVRVRSITSNWILQLQHEVRSTLDGDMAGKAATFAFWAALLCRQTFWGCLGHAGFEETVLKDDPLPFFRSSIALQENLLDSSDKLPTHLRSLLTQDMSASYNMRSIVEKWVESHIGLVEKAINETWASASALANRSYSPWKKLQGKHSWWISSKTAPSGSIAPQQVHYHILQGHLLVDQKPLGRLPLEIRDNESILELFEGRHLLTRPSGLLDYQILVDMEGHQVHVGIRDSKITIKALFRGSILHFIPRSMLKGPIGWDLPADLVDDCVHWLDLTTGNLEMRRKPRIWRRKKSNWILDIRKRRATRNTGASLVEPNSEIGRKFSSIFRDFEDSKRLTIYQPANGDLSVELKRLEIRFQVNHRGLLFCPQLKAEVDPQQDIGTLHGLCSRVTLRDASNPDRRIVLIPIGNIRWQREGIHVAVRISNEGVYAKYTLNSVLGRLDCPPEPLLLYLKAAIHALTSFPLPDVFTGKTGTEEARHCLLSSRSQPWAPLAGFPHRMLSVIKSLSPERTLYPPGIDIYQKVHWDQHLTSTIQHEDLAPLVTFIERRSRDLEAFSMTEPHQDNMSHTASVAHLQIRGRIRRQLYERVCFESDSTVLSQAAQPVNFIPNVAQKSSERSCRVYQTIRAVMESDIGAFRLPKLAPILETWSTFRGFKESLSDIDLAATLGVGAPQLWGSVVQKLHEKDPTRTHDKHFSLALFAFDDDVDMAVIMWLVALLKSSTLSRIQPPNHTLFTNFHHFEEPPLVPHVLVNRMVEYGVLTTRLQRYLRIEDAILRRDDRWLEENFDTEGHSNWNPLKYPEWLLLEIDNNMLIRPIQFEVAHAIISPPSMSNSVLQMNMGQVPFEAKGIPSQTAEYGHPDTALVLTCLSFYHAGLTKSQLLQSLRFIGNSEDPSSHYQRFTSLQHLPETLQHWHLLEMEDEAQISLLWRHLRFEKHVVNHFMNNFAFPQHAKQFGVKLQASAWDIPLLSESMERQGMTTGFSGTNDNKKILPRTIRQDDLPSLVQTNAEVLVHLLEPRNQRCFQAVDQHGRHLNEIGILELLRSNGIKILIDAGAQILEMENHQLAAAWLDVHHEAQGAVYFDKNSRIMVRARFQKTPVPLLASSFADNLDKCVVYIDEAHTRGTDLKLPIYAQGAVTLGINSTKDQITQAAMRLRQLATTQSIAFVAPPEVYTSVLSLRSEHSPKVAASQPLKSTDIIHWLLEQSCQASDNMMSLHIAQGFDFCRREDALLKFRKSSQSKKTRDKLLKEAQQPEGQTLEQLYGPKEQASSTGFKAIKSAHLKSFVKELYGLQADLVKHQRRACSSAFDEVEQEREVEFEVHQLREKQNPTHLTALQFPGLDKALLRFCEEPVVELASLHFIKALDLIGHTYLGLKYGIKPKATSSKLLVSKEFSRTVQPSKADASLHIMRPVEWVLWRPDIETALVVIPEEAELLLPILRRIHTLTTFLLTYTSPHTRSLLEVGHLAYYPVPTPKKELAISSWLSIEIGLMAGRLYLPYDEYTQLRSCLQVDEMAEPSVITDNVHRSRKQILPNFGVLNTQLLSRFLAEWIPYRSRSSDIMHNPMGYLLQNRDLPANHPFFTFKPKSAAIETRSLAVYGVATKCADDQDSDDESE